MALEFANFTRMHASIVKWIVMKQLLTLRTKGDK